jgi:VWFA-related protein
LPNDRSTQRLEAELTKSQSKASAGLPHWCPLIYPKLAGVAVLLFLSGGSLLHAQAAPAPTSTQGADASQPSPTIRQNVNNVLVDVVVTDKNGQPVKNLSKDHFQILENGAAQQVVFFEEHQADPAPAPPPQQLQLPPNVYTNVASTALDTGPTLVLLMDALNTPSADQVKVRLAMLDYLRKLPPGRRIAIFALTSKLRMIQGFDSDPATLMASLDQAATWQKQSHLTDDAGTDSYADGMPKVFDEPATPLFQSFVAREQSWRVDQRVGLTLGALDSLATYLSAMPGRKNLIWFSGAFPIGLGADSTTPQGAGAFQTENLGRSRDYSTELKKTNQLLKLARVAVYPMDPTALPTPTMFGVTQNNNNSLAGGAPALQINQESSDEMGSHFTMDTIAEATGGRAFHNTNDLAGAIGTVTQLGSNYYTFGYVPKDANYDGKYRKLTVKVDTLKVRLDYRRGYYAEDPSKPGVAALSHPARTAPVLLRGAPNATDILFKVRVAPTESVDPGTQRGVRYSINWSVDLRSLNLEASADGARHGSLTVAAVAYNSDSKVINSVSMPVSISLTSDDYSKYLKTGLQFHQELDLHPGFCYLRVAIVSSESDRAGATEIPLSIKVVQTQASTPPTKQ